MAYDYLPEELKDLIGKETESRPAPVSVQRELINHWVEAFEDSNPVYTDDELAEKSVYKGIIAPPGMLISWTIPFYWTPKDGHTNPEEWSLHFTVKRLLNTPVSIVMEYRGEWYIPVRPGDRISVSEMLTDVSPRTQKKVGTGHVFSINLIMRNQKGEVVGKPGWTAFAYGSQNPPTETLGGEEE